MLTQKTRHAFKLTDTSFFANLFLVPGIQTRCIEEKSNIDERHLSHRFCNHDDDKMIGNIFGLFVSSSSADPLSSNSAPCQYRILFEEEKKHGNEWAIRIQLYFGLSPLKQVKMNENAKPNV